MGWCQTSDGRAQLVRIDCKSSNMIGTYLSVDTTAPAPAHRVAFVLNGKQLSLPLQKGEMDSLLGPPKSVSSYRLFRDVSTPMTITPKRRFQFSLRWLIVMMTVLCVLLSRIAYFRQRAIYHEQEAAHYENLISQRSHLSLDDVTPMVQAYEHRYLAHRYRRAMYRPLTVIFEPTLPWNERKEPNNCILKSRP